MARASLGQKGTVCNFIIIASISACILIFVIYDVFDLKANQLPWYHFHGN